MHALWQLALPLLACRLAGAQEPAAREAGTLKEPLVAVATLGATTRAPTKQEIEDLALTVTVRARGQVITEVVADGPLARAGLVCGDVLVKLDANEIFSQDDIADFLATGKPEQEVRASVVRGKTKQADTVAVRLGTVQVQAPARPRLVWEFASLAQLPVALAKAKKEGKRVLVGLSGAET
jgi:predicted metalloprotease with PDZ domain